MSDDITAVESRWLNDRAKSQASTGPRTPDIEAMDMETYTQSITAMNDSLYDLQSDIQVVLNEFNSSYDNFGNILKTYFVNYSV